MRFSHVHHKHWHTNNTFSDCQCDQIHSALFGVTETTKSSIVAAHKHNGQMIYYIQFVLKCAHWIFEQMPKRKSNNVSFEHAKHLLAERHMHYAIRVLDDCGVLP